MTKWLFLTLLLFVAFGVEAFLFALVYGSDMILSNKVIELTTSIVKAHGIETSVFAVAGAVIAAILFRETITKRPVFTGGLIERIPIAIRVLIYIVVFVSVTYAAYAVSYIDWVKILDTYVDSLIRITNPLYTTLKGTFIYAGVSGASTLAAILLYLIVVPRIIDALQKAPKIGYYAAGFLTFVLSMVCATIMNMFTIPAIETLKTSEVTAVIIPVLVFFIGIGVFSSFRKLLFKSNLDYAVAAGPICSIGIAVYEMVSTQAYATVVATWISLLIFIIWFIYSLMIALSIAINNARLYMVSCAVIGSMLITPMTTIMI